jgi:ABC-2 type transport system permease protein
MRREGSAFQGLGIVLLKELSDQVTGWRMFVLELLITVTALVSVVGAISEISIATAEDPYLLLHIFTRGTPLSFVAWLSFLVPLVSIGLGFDLVNSEHNQRTLSRVLSQPIYRDALLFGKFLAGLATISIGLLTLWLLLIGFGLFKLGIPPGGEEIGRALVFLLVTIAYAGVWLALALLLSVVFRSAATAALTALGLWLFLTFLWPEIVQKFLTPSTGENVQAALDALNTQLALGRVSPSTLFSEIVAVILDPSVHSTQQSIFKQMGFMLLERGAVPGAPIPLLQSVLVVWGQIVGLVAGTILLFVVSYIVFQRQEVRA